MKTHVVTVYSSNKKRKAPELYQSEKLKQLLLSTDIEYIIEALKSVNEAIDTVSALPGFEENAERIETARKEIDSGVLRKFKVLGGRLNEKLLLKLISAAIREKKAGNCYEYSLLCYKLLDDKGRKTEIVRFNNGEHVFLLYNRDKSTDIGNSMSWNKDTIIIDPFFAKVYPVAEMFDHMQLCIHDKKHNKVSYIPYNPDKHQMSNEVISGLMEDWRQILTQKQSLRKH